MSETIQVNKDIDEINICGSLVYDADNLAVEFNGNVSDAISNNDSYYELVKCKIGIDSIDYDDDYVCIDFVVENDVGNFTAIFCVETDDPEVKLSGYTQKINNLSMNQSVAIWVAMQSLADHLLKKGIKK